MNTALTYDTNINNNNRDTFVYRLIPNITQSDILYQREEETKRGTRGYKDTRNYRTIFKRNDKG